MSTIEPIRHRMIPPTAPHKSNDVFRQYQIIAGLRNETESNDHVYAFQGGCTDGSYVYTVLWKNNDNNCILQKREGLTYTVIAENDQYNYSHAGGMTYCEKDGYLYIAHAGGDNKTVSRVDRETLQRVGLVTCPSNIMNITYSKEHDLFVGCIASPYHYGVYKLEGDALRLVYHIKPAGSPLTYGKQSLFCDGDFIFSVFSDAIHVFTWTGEFVRLLDIPDLYNYYGDKFEVEWAFIRNNRLVLGVYTGYLGIERFNSIWSCNTSFYEDAAALIGKTGINSLGRAPSGTMIRLFGYEQHDGVSDIDLNRFMTFNPDNYKYLKIRYVGYNVGCADWFKTGKLTLREFNTADDTSSGKIQFNEMQLNLSDDGILSVESNIQLVHDIEEGTFTKHAAPDSSTTNYINIIEIWGVI